MPFVVPIRYRRIVLGIKDGLPISDESQCAVNFPIPDGRPVVVRGLVLGDVVRRQPAIVDPGVSLLRLGFAPGEEGAGVRGQFGANVAGCPDLVGAHLNRLQALRFNDRDLTGGRCSAGHHRRGGDRGGTDTSGGHLAGGIHVGDALVGRIPGHPLPESIVGPDRRRQLLLRAHIHPQAGLVQHDGSRDDRFGEDGTDGTTPVVR